MNPHTAWIQWCPCIILILTYTSLVTNFMHHAIFQLVRKTFIMVIELSGVQFGLKSYAWFQNWTSAQREFDLKSQVWFQTKIAGHEVQLPLYYIHFEIAKLFSQYQYFIDQVAGLLKSRNKKAFTSHFVFETEMMRYRTKMVRFKTEMMRFRTWMTRFGTDAI